ncbi:DUF4268 domain-containing protein [Azonexus hydrophilus]|uniref:DUF4268 domain-containing protein n=1 Tax=Azonexus hydrophilus TaxID=418702 RepID=UPI0009F911D4|nr:DUF4268 domain-containing protein [Azonexus hydrophilus]
MNLKLGKLKKIDLREYWKHEALDFTRWLALPENLEELGNEIGVDITLIQTEAGVGRFSADILAQEETTGRKIVIENQLETTDHSHLGQILTYAAGIEAEYIVWIVREARDEHKQAVDWLNEHTDEKINFFLIRIELWQIGDSNPAPKFVVVSRPNDWTKSIRGTANEQTALSETKLMQLDFWQQLHDFAVNQKPPLRLRTPRAQHWYDVAIGRSDCHVALTALITENQIGCEIYIPNSKALFHSLHSNQVAIETALGLSGLLWQELPERKASRIRAFLPFDFARQPREVAFRWLFETTLKFKAVFAKPWPLASTDGQPGNI